LSLLCDYVTITLSFSTNFKNNFHVFARI
jgi:hypothetical protein